MEEQKPTMSSPSLSSQKPENMFDAMPPKFAFWAGIVTATAVIAIIGFALMLYLLLSGAEIGSGDAAAPTAKAAANTNAAAAPAADTVSGSVDMDKVRNIQGKGDLTLIEFSDLDCPFCKQFNPTVKQIVKDYDGKVGVAFMHFPLSIHPGAQGAAIAAECAAEQNKFWEFVDNHFTAAGTNLTADEHIANGEKIGLNKDKFADCVNSKKTETTVDEDAALAQSLGATGTPFSVIVDKKGTIVGSINGALPAAQVKAKLDALVK